MSDSAKRDNPSPFLQDNLDAFLNFDDSSTSFLPSPSAAISSSSPASSPASSHTNTPSMSRVNPSTSTPEFSAPSHPYSLHMQQTDILGAMDLADNFYADGSFIHMDTDAPYFYPDPPATSRPDAMSQGISPMVTIGETAPRVKLEASPAPTMHQPQQRMNFYPGYHQQMFQMKLMQEEQAQQQQQKIVRQKAAPSRVPSHPQQAAIDSIFDSFKVSPNVGRSRGNGDILPHIARMKKEEEEMDDDERLLASEEGKKLSSKERRQLRNKVSARAFRSRRKEYISQLEAEVAKKTAEAEAAIAESDRLKAENNNLRNFSEHMMKHPAFQEFLKDMTNPLMKQAPAVQPPPRTVAPAAVEPSYNPMRDYNPNIASEEHQWPLAYGQWNNTSHVYNVQMPEDPVLDFDGKMGFEEDFTIADGFFSGIRNEKGTIDWDLMDEQNDDEVIYQPPENIEDLYIEQEAALKTRNLDELFPGVGVNSLLERLEMVASGEARAEDLFEITELPAVKAAPEKQLPSSSCGQEERTPSVCKSNRMLHEAEGVFRRIGLAVGGK